MRGGLPARRRLPRPGATRKRAGGPWAGGATKSKGWQDDAEESHAYRRRNNQSYAVRIIPSLFGGGRMSTVAQVGLTLSFHRKAKEFLENFVVR